MPVELSRVFIFPRLFALHSLEAPMGPFRAFCVLRLAIKENPAPCGFGVALLFVCFGVCPCVHTFSWSLCRCAVQCTAFTGACLSDGLSFFPSLLLFRMFQVLFRGSQRLGRVADYSQYAYICISHSARTSTKHTRGTRWSSTYSRDNECAFVRSAEVGGGQRIQFQIRGRGKSVL